MRGQSLGGDRTLLKVVGLHGGYSWGGSEGPAKIFDRRDYTSFCWGRRQTGEGRRRIG